MAGVSQLLRIMEENIFLGEDLSLEIPSETLGQIFFHFLCINPPDNVLMVESETNRHITTSEFLILSLRTAEALKELGLQQGDRIALFAKNGIDISAAATATLFLGAAVSPIDPSMQPYELLHLLRLIEPKVVFGDADVLDVLAKVVEEFEEKITVVLFFGNSDTEYQFTTFENFLKEDADPTNFSPASSEDTTKSIAFLACSSGTMGLPKVVMLSDKSLVFQLAMWRWVDNKDNMGGLHTSLMHTSHFFWITGIFLFIACTCSGRRRIIVRDPIPENIMGAIDKFKPSAALMVPSLIDAIMSHPSMTDFNLSSIKLIIFAGSALQKATIDRIQNKWPNQIIATQGYGCTEVGGVFTMPRVDEDVASVGRPMPGTKLKIVNDEKICGPNEEGELLLKTPSLMNGYVKNEEATREAIDEDGWFHTGDIGYYKEGLIYISGRIKELIKYKGMQIAPAELEALIMSVKGVADVGVSGIKIDSYTYHPMAMVVKKENSDLTEEEIIKCVNDNLSDYKHLRGGVCFVDRIPRTTTGKIKRRDLQSLAETLYMDI